jgi:hypothetical protein
MNEEFDDLSPEEKLKAENEFLKMKMMLENGAQFGKVEGIGENDLPPELENQFLQNIMAFEKQFAERKTIKVYDKIKQPTHFKPVAEIADEDIDEAWTTLQNYMQKFGVNLDVISPNIKSRELYRFATEELFEQETDDIDIPGMMSGFIYDEYYPDPEFESLRQANTTIQDILKKEALEYAFDFRKDDLQLNKHKGITSDELLEKVNRYKASYDDIIINETELITHNLTENNNKVIGKYSITVHYGSETETIENKWMLELEFDGGYWVVATALISGIEF